MITLKNNLCTKVYVHKYKTRNIYKVSVLSSAF